MTRLLAPVAALAAALGAVTAAVAAPPAPACPLVTDPAGDGQPNILRGVPHSQNAESLDLLSLDFATGRETAVLVLRVADLAPATPEPFNPLGAGYTASFTGGAHKYAVSLNRRNGTDIATFVRDGVAVAGVVATVDEVASAITFRLPRALLGSLPARAEFRSFAATTYPNYGVQTNADGMAGPAVYVDGSRGCIAAD